MAVISSCWGERDGECQFPDHWNKLDSDNMCSDRIKKIKPLDAV